MSKQITIRIYPDGKIETKTQGIKGKTCLKYLSMRNSDEREKRRADSSS